MTTRDPPTTLTRQQLADRLNVDVRTVDRWRGLKGFPRPLNTPPGCRTIRFDAEAIDAFLKEAN